MMNDIFLQFFKTKKQQKKHFNGKVYTVNSANLSVCMCVLNSMSS